MEGRERGKESGQREREENRENKFTRSLKLRMDHDLKYLYVMNPSCSGGE